MASSHGVSLADFLPQVPKTPQVHREPEQAPQPRRRRQRTNQAKQSSANDVTATVTRQRRRASPPIAPVAPSAPEEGKREKFMRLGAGRMVNVLRSIRLLGNLANRGIYEWTEQDVKTMRQAIDAQLDQSFSKFERSAVVRLENTFKFGEV